jgi:hypothetical protein
VRNLFCFIFFCDLQFFIHKFPNPKTFISYFQANPIIAIKRTDRSLKNILSFFNVYHLDAWLSMLGVFILFTVFGLTVRQIEWRLNLTQSRNFAEILWKMAKFQLIQSEGINYKLLAGKLFSTLK